MQLLMRTCLFERVLQEGGTRANESLKLFDDMRRTRLLKRVLQEFKLSDARYLS